MNANISPLESSVTDLNEIAWACQYTDPKKSLTYAARCIALCQQNGDALGMAYALLNRGFYEVRFCPHHQAEATLRDAEGRFIIADERRGIHLARSALCGILLMRNEFDAAQEILKEVLSAPPHERQPIDAYFALYRLGFLHFYRGEVNEGLRYYYQALVLVQRESAMSLTCQALSDLGSAQMELGNYAEARELLEQAFVICTTMPVCIEHMIIGNLASVHLEMGNPQAALKLLDGGIALDNLYYQAGDAAFLTAVFAQTHVSLKNWEIALPLTLQALALAQQDGDGEVINQAQWLIGLVEQGMGRLDESVHWLLQAEAGLAEIQNIFYVLHVYQALAGVYAEMKQFESAYHYLRRYQEQYEQSLGATAKAQFLTLQIQHEMSQIAFERDHARQQQLALENLNNELRHKMSQVEDLQMALREQAMRDPLTGLYNRRFLNEQIVPILDHARRSDTPVLIVLLDLDHFKQVNDTYGHGFGDQVLVALAELILKKIRNTDLAIRYGGEEFCLVFPASNAVNGLEKMERLLTTFRATVITSADKSMSGLTFSAGVATFPTDGVNAETLLRTADKALYAAKALGRDRILLAQQTQI
jgi:two-component system cell cycle response regulator